MINRESKKRRLNLAWLAVAMLAVVFVASALAQDEPNDPNIPFPYEPDAPPLYDPNAPFMEDPNLQAEPQIPGRVEGTGTYFEVNDSNYLNITFESSEPVHLILESIPQMVVMDIEAAEGATSTWITLTGFEPSTTYYKYEDNYHNDVPFTTDLDGSYSFVQDLSEPHLVFIQPQPGTKFIPSDTSIGTWDPVNRIYTLTTDVSETIQIDEDDLTLDGAGHTVTGPGWGSGVYLSGRTGVTIQNVNVQGFTYGIDLRYSSYNTLTGNTASNNNAYGIFVMYGSRNTLTGNTVNWNKYRGIYLYSSTNNTLTGNTVNSDHMYGIFLDNSSNNTLTGNTASNNDRYGIYLWSSTGNTLTGNTASNNQYGIYLDNSSHNTLLNNAMSGNQYNFHVYGSLDSHYDHDIDTSNTVDGKPVYYVKNAVGQVYDNSTIPNAGVLYCINCESVTIRDLTFTDNVAAVHLWNTHNSRIENVSASDNLYGIFLDNSSNNTLTGNTANSNSLIGIYLYYSGGNNTLTGNTAWNNYYGIYLESSNGSTLTGNDASSNGNGIYLFNSGGNTLTGNTTSNNWHIGIYLVYSGNNTLTGNTTWNNYHGIYLFYSSDCILTGNTANSSTYHGIYLYTCNNNTLTANTASNNYYGIGLWNSSNNSLTDNTASNNVLGIVLHLCEENTLTGNTANSNSSGIYLRYSSDNTLTDNTASNNYYGIYLRDCTGNTLAGNTVSNNSLWGIYLRDSCSYNQIYNNNFINNTTQAYVRDNCYDNVFNLDKPIGGNYWSNWTTPDENVDGFVDNPYVFTGGQDNLPWTLQDGWIAVAVTWPGTDVVVQPEYQTTGQRPVTLTFDEVTEPGMTTLSCTAPGENQGPPSGFKVGQPPTIFDISTTAVFEGEVQVCIDYSGISFSNESNLNLFHFENGHWVEVPTSLDTENKIICGTVMSLSFFGIFELENQPPEVTINSPASGLVQAVNTQIDFVGTIIDPDTDDTHTATWTISNENWPEDIVIVGSITGNTVSNPVEFVDAGIYSIKLTVTDEAGASGEATTVNNDPECPAFIVIYDPSAGFVTGGGWIYSPTGALLDSAAEGKASFGFVAKYKKGATVPTGNTEFRFRAGNFKFKSSSYEWLVVAGTKAMFKGEGTIDGMDGSFKFMLTGVDDTEDKFRIKISDPASEEAIYDNKRSEGDDAEPTTIGGGSIVIHKK